MRNKFDMKVNEKENEGERLVGQMGENCGVLRVLRGDIRTFKMGGPHCQTRRRRGKSAPVISKVQK